MGIVTGELLEPSNDSLMDYLSSEMRHRELMKEDLSVTGSSSIT